MKELYPKKPRELTEEEESELDKTIKFSGNKLFDTFNIGKSMYLLQNNVLKEILKQTQQIKYGAVTGFKDGTFMVVGLFENMNKLNNSLIIN